MDVPAEALVDLGVVRDNVTGLRKHIGTAELMAVVKSDAYGHGMIPVAKAALAGGARWLG
jgi:alanine racemase